MSDNQIAWLDDLKALEAKIRQAKRILEHLHSQHDEMVKQQLWAKGPYKPVHSKPKNIYYNKEVERLDGNWKGKEHIDH